MIKLLGRGEYVAEGARDDERAFRARRHELHAFDGAEQAISRSRHATSAEGGDGAGGQPPYPRRAAGLAEHCTRQEDAANKVERLTKKAAAALWLSDRIGQVFDAIVTGAGPKGTWVRLMSMPVEGRLEKGFQGLDVGDRVRARLIGTNPQRGFIDFARA